MATTEAAKIVEIPKERQGLVDPTPSLPYLTRLRKTITFYKYGNIFTYLSVWTIIQHFLVLFSSLFYTLESREELHEKLNKSIRKKFDLEDDNEIVVGETARSLFYAFCLALDLGEDDLIIITPLQHYSFIKIIKALGANTVSIEMKKDGSGWDFETFFKHLTPSQARRCRAFVVTHMFGNSQNYDAIADWCHENDVFIFEDSIQGWTLFQSHGHPRAHMTVFSGGMDKIPCTTKGGFGVVRHNKDLGRRVQGVIENFPDKTWHKRLSDLLSQCAYWYVTATKFGTTSIMLLGQFYHGHNCIADTVHWIRNNFLKAYVGKFTVDRVEWRPSEYHLLSMILGIERAERTDVEMLHRARARFRKHLGKYAKVCMPWSGINHKEDANLYFHCLFKNRDQWLNFMSDRGFVCCYQQAWGIAEQLPSHPKTEYAHHLRENMAYLPLTHQMSDAEMKAMADACIEYLDQYQGDMQPWFSA